MKTHWLLLALLLSPALAPADEPLRPPSVPLVTCDPYFSIWSPADRLTATNTTHWTGKPHRLSSLASIDGKQFRIMGTEPAGVPALKQKSLTVLPTRTIYSFEGAGVALTLTFMTPALPNDLDVLSRPVTYLTYEFCATDGKKHEVAFDLDASAEIAVNTPNQEVVLTTETSDGNTVVKVGSKDQPILAKRGDDIRIDWGYLYIAKPALLEELPRPQSIQIRSQLQNLKEGPASSVHAGVAFDGFFVSAKPVSRWLMIAYDDLYSIQYMKRNLRPYWRRPRMINERGEEVGAVAVVGFIGHTKPFRYRSWEAADLLRAAARDYNSLRERCEAFDEELMGDLTRAGGEKYAKLCALAYRQCFAGGKFVADANGKPLQFCKENHSNGCISTSDVFYPMAPQFLLFGPTLAKSFLVPFMNYAASERWRFPFAPHDLGQYPHANGQRYGGGERTEENQMPVEESGNLLCIFGAIAQMGWDYTDFAGLYWKQLEQWADYLKAKGFDPENQLCTDDFAGHLAHNVNLSAKAICGLGAFAKLCEKRAEIAANAAASSEARAKSLEGLAKNTGNRKAAAEAAKSMDLAKAKLAEMRDAKTKAAEYMKLAKEFAARWVKEADDGDHFRLAFDRPGTWSQKYNLIWDRILGLNLFPAEVAKKEMAYYRKIQNAYGLPLDNRKDYTKLDWITWTATLTQDRSDFEALIAPIWKFMNETPDRSPLTDWYQTKTAKKVGFTARPVIGGVFAQMLYDKAVWAKYAGRDKTKASGWAPMPVAPKIVTVVPASDKEPFTWRYTTQRPEGQWFAADFDVSAWKEGPAGFGAGKPPGSVIRTVWKTADIWLRREMTLSDGKLNDPQFWVHHDEDVEIYVNGVLAATAAGYITDYEVLMMNPAGKAALKPGKNLIAVHCHQTTGGQYIDVGIVDAR